MEKKKFNDLIKDKTPEELHRIISRATNNIIHLTDKQINKVIDIKNKLLRDSK